MVSKKQKQEELFTELFTLVLFVSVRTRKVLKFAVQHFPSPLCVPQIKIGTMSSDLKYAIVTIS